MSLSTSNYAITSTDFEIEKQLPATWRAGVRERDWGGANTAARGKERIFHSVLATAHADRSTCIDHTLFFFHPCVFTRHGYSSREEFCRELHSSLIHRLQISGVRNPPSSLVASVFAARGSSLGVETEREDNPSRLPASFLAVANIDCALSMR